MRSGRLLVPTVGFLAGAWCLTASAAEGKSKTFVSIPPQAYFVHRIGGAHVEVNVLVAPGQSPHIFEPTAKQIGQLSEAQMYFSMDLPFERTLLKKIHAMNKDLRIVDISEGVKRLSVKSSREDDEHAEADQTRGAGGNHTDHQSHHHPEGEADPHLWLNPRLVKIMAGNIGKALTAVDPAHADDYKKNVRQFEKDLDGVDKKIAQALASLKGGEFFVFHAAFAYFADAYDLKQVPVEIGGKEPSARQLAELIEKAKAQRVKVIFVQPQFSRKSAAALAEAIGGAVVPMDPLARDYLKNLEDMCSKIQRALAKPTDTQPGEHQS